MKLRNKKGFTIIELVIVIAVIGILTAVLVPTFINLTNKANEAADQSLVKNLNTALKAEEQLLGNKKNETLHDAIEDLEAEGYILENLISKSGQDLLWNKEKNEFLLNNNAELKGEKYWQIVDKIPSTQKYSYYAGKNFKESKIENLEYGFDVGTNTSVSLIEYEPTTSTGREVAIRTNGGTLTINAPLDTVKHYGEGAVVNLNAVSSSSYFENGSVDQVNIKTGRLVLTNNAETSVRTIYLQATDDNYNNIIIATQNGAELPENISRDPVSVPTGEDTKTVVTIQTNVDATGKAPQKTETINLYSAKDVKEQTSGYDVSALGTLVVEAITAEAKEQAAEQISDPKVLEKVEESKSAVAVESEEELNAAIGAKAKYIIITKDFPTTAVIDVTTSTIIDGQNHIITCGAGATRALWVSANDVDLKLQNIKIVSHAKTERGIQVNSGVKNVKLNLVNVEITKVVYYCVNICNNVDVDITIDGCSFSGYGAINLWSAKYDVVIKNSTLNGINDKTYNAEGWNDFATIILEGDSTGKTTDHSSVIDVKLVNCVVTATSTTGNKQSLFGFNPNATSNTVTAIGCKLELDDSGKTFKYYDYGEGNKLYVDNELINK